MRKEEVEHIALLARLYLSDEEKERLGSQLSKILDYFRVLEEVDTEDVPPTFHVLPITNVMRDDEPSPSFPEEEILMNAPSREGGLFRIKPVFEE